MAAAGEEGFWTKLAKDLTTLRICTIVARQIRAGEVPPEPSVMLSDIAEEFERCLTEFESKGSPLSGTERDIAARITTSCAEIGRLYATIDARARSPEVQADPVVQDYKARLKTRDVDVSQPWARGIDRNTFANFELRAKTLLQGVGGRERAVLPDEPWNEEEQQPGQKNAVPPPPETTAAADSQLIASNWPIVPEKLAAAAQEPGLRAIAPPATDDAYQAACRRLFRLEPDEVIVLRKIWELGTDVVLMETVIQLDGDIFSRVRQSHEADANLQSTHRQLLDAAMNNWHFMVEAIGKFISVIEQGLIRR